MSGVDPSLVNEIDLFHGLEPDQLNWISERLYCRTYPGGASIITAEQPGEVIYIIRSGTVKIHVEQADGTDVILAILGPGDVVGEMSLIDSSGRSASVITLEESQLIWMAGSTFQECLRNFLPVSQNLVRILSTRVRLANELIQALATLDVHGRVARQMLAFAERYGRSGDNGDLLIPIRLTQSDIADLVGASRKRVNQVMVTFKQQGYISVDEKSRITVHDRKALARLCR
ncbi:MAG: Crp/Fnr family transcriptional regulator [Chloroflexota bacterium]